MNRLISFILLTIPFMVALADNDDMNGPTVPDGYIGGHAYVDLGLPSGTLWAVYNVGSNDEYYSGDYFAWGETEPKENYEWENYAYFKDYKDDPNHPVELEDIGKCISGTEHDAATVNWGNGWRMPDSVQIAEVRKHTFSRRVVENGMEGMRVYSRAYGAKKSIFLGDFGNGYNEGEIYSDGLYWSGVASDVYYDGTGTRTWAKSIECQKNTEEVAWTGYFAKFAGLNIRAVVKKSNSINALHSAFNGNTISVFGKSVIINGEIIDGNLELTDMSGRMASSIEIKESRCNLPDITPGLYIASVIKDGVRLFSDKIILK